MTLQKYQEYAINNGMSFTLDVINNPDETKALVTIRYVSTCPLIADQRYVNVSFSSDEAQEEMDTKLVYINNFMYQVSTSLDLKTEE